VEAWLDLLSRRPVVGGAVFDLQIVAAMLANDVRPIYTFNLKDFEPFPEGSAHDTLNPAPWLAQRSQLKSEYKRMALQLELPPV